MTAGPYADYAQIAPLLSIAWATKVRRPPLSEEVLVRLHRRSTLSLQLSLLIGAILLEVAASFASSTESDSGFVAFMQAVAVPAVIGLLLALIVGNIVVFWLEHPHADRPQWSRDRVPYPGLAAFAERDAAVFFGRDGQVSELVARLHGLQAEAADRFVVVTGASGSGKSSLVHAGVIPRLRARRWTVLPPLTPAGEPLRRLAALTETSDTSQSQVTSGDRDRTVRVRTLFTTEGSFADAVARWRRRTGNRFSRVLIVVDQMEELVTLSGTAERDAFLTRLREALQADRGLWLVATLRIEFLPELLAGQAAGMFESPFALGSFSRAELVAIVQRPAELAGMGFEEGLVGQIVDETGNADALPLLAYLLQELYFAVGSGGTATFEAYRALGGVVGALARQADAVFTEMRGVYGPEPVLSLLLRLVAMDGAEPTRRRLPMSVLDGDEQRIIETFTDARLLTVDASGDSAFVQVTHEALFRRWAPLRQQVATRAEQLRRRTELDRWAAEWIRSGRSPDYLLTGARLALAAQWLEAIESAGQDSPDGRALVQASRSRDLTFLRRVSESIGEYALANVDLHPELSVLLTAAALAECPVTPLARRALMTALAHSRTEHVLTGHTDAVRAVAWATDGSLVATASRDGTARLWDPDTATTLVTLCGHAGMLDGLALSPDARLVATASRDRTVRIWDTRDGAPIAVLSCGDFARQVAFSPDGSRLVATSRDRLVRIWETDTWRAWPPLRGHEGDVWGVDWSSDSTRLATASHDRTVIIWDVATSKPVDRLGPFAEFVEAVRWSPDGDLLAIGGGDGLTHLYQPDGAAMSYPTGQGPVWSLAWAPDGHTVFLALGDQQSTVRIENLTAHSAIELHGHTQPVWSVALSPGATRLITGSADTTARIWTLHARGAETKMLAGHRQPIICLSVAEGGTIATGSADRTVRRWPLQAPPVTSPMEAPVVALAWAPDGLRLAVVLSDKTLRIIGSDEPTTIELSVEAECLAWSPDGAQLATGCKDDTIRILDARTGTETLMLSGHTDWVGALAWSPSGRHIASGSDDRTIRLWHLDHPTNPEVLTGHHNYVDGLTWAPDERSVASCSADWTIRVWNTSTGEPIRQLSGHERRVRAVAWSPDGRRLASGSDDHTVRVWDPYSDAASEVIGVHTGPITCTAWLPDSKHVVTGSTDSTARIWCTDVDIDGLIAAARTRVFRTLSDDERRTHQLPSG